MPKVFITGLGFITSIGNDIASVTRNLRELKHGIEVYPPFQKLELGLTTLHNHSDWY